MTLALTPFDASLHMEKASSLPFSYYSSRPYLDYCAYLLNRDGKELVVWQSDVRPHEFPAIYTPKDATLWETLQVGCATQDELEAISASGVPILWHVSMGTEFFYNTEDFTNPKKDLAQRIRQFKKKYPDAKVLSSYPVEKINAFIASWLKQRERPADNTFESMRFFHFCLKRLEKYAIKQVYVEVDGKLAGLAWGIEHSPGKWVGLQLKVDYAVKGISRYMHHLRANLFADRPEFTLGSASEPGTEQYKRELGPAHTTQWFTLETGRRSK